MVEGLLQPGFNTDAMGTSFDCAQIVEDSAPLLRCFIAHNKVILLTLSRFASTARRSRSAAKSLYRSVAQQADWHVTKLWSRFPDLSSGERRCPDWNT
jgi:hypothetical protein